MRKFDLWKPVREDENNTKYYDKNGNVQVIVKRNINVKGKPTCMMWFGKAQNPRYNYYFENEEICTNFINEHVSAYINNANKKLDKKQLVKELRKNYQPKVNIGDIFHSSYGYNMTLNSWFQILSIKNKTVEMQEIQMEMIPTGYLQWQVRPIKNAFVGKPFKKTIQIDFTNIDKPHEYIKISRCEHATNVTELVNSGRTWLQNECD